MILIDLFIKLIFVILLILGRVTLIELLVQLISVRPMMGLVVATIYFYLIVFISYNIINWSNHQDKFDFLSVGKRIFNMGRYFPFRLWLFTINCWFRLYYLLPFVNRQRERFSKERKPFLRFKTWRSFLIMGVGFNALIIMLTVYLTGIIKALIHFIYYSLFTDTHYPFDWNVLRWTNLFQISEFWFSPILAFPLTIIGAWIVWKSAWINWEQYRDYNANESGDDRFTSLSKIRQQYTAIPDRNLSYPGLGGVPIIHTLQPNLAGLTLGTLMRFRGGRISKHVLAVLQRSRLSQLVSGTYYIARETVNTLVNGTPRSGKGESLVNPTIDIMSRATEKSSLVVTDPKGELYQASYRMLRERGYNVNVLSFQQMDWSMSYNPLALAIDSARRGYYEKTQQRVNAVAEAIYRKSKNGGTKGNEKYWEDTSISLFNAIAMALIDRANEAYKSGETDAWGTVTVRNIAKFLVDLGSETVEIDADGNEVVIKEKGVKYQKISRLTQYFNELRKINRVRFSKFREMADINLRTSDFASEETKGNVYSSMLSGINLFLQDNIARLTSRNSLDLESVGNPRRIQVHFRSSRVVGKRNFFAYQTAYISILSGFKTIVNNEKVLLDEAGYLNYVIVPKLPKRFTIIINFDDNERNNAGVLDSSCQITCEKIFNLTEDQFSHEHELKEVAIKGIKTKEVDLGKKDISIAYTDKPTALFLVTPPNRSEYNAMTTLLIDQLFNANYEVALNAGRKTVIRIQFILDELGNQPAIPKLAEKLNIGLGQNILFMLFVQELSQLVEKYGQEEADNIMAGCSLNMLIKTAVDGTARTYSKLLGTRTITKRTKTSNILNEANPNINTTNPEQPLMTPTQLKNLQVGEMVVVRGVKATDNDGRKVTPDPIFAHGKTEMPYRYMFLSESIDQSLTTSDIPVESLHRDLDLRANAVDGPNVLRQIIEWCQKLEAGNGIQSASESQIENYLPPRTSFVYSREE